MKFPVRALYPLVLLLLPSVLLAAPFSITEGQMRFSWEIKGDTLEATMTAPTTSWVGVGFNPSRAMKDANYVLGYVKDGKPKVTDHFGKGLRQHAKDTKLGGKTNVTLISGEETATGTTITFAIPLDSGDAKDTKLDPAKPTVLLMAYGSGRDTFRSKHSWRGQVRVNLATGERL